MRKEIVHNKHVVEQLRDRGAIFVDELDDTIPEGAITVFCAHGVSPAVHDDAERRSLQTIDATCPLVTKVHREAVKFAGEGYTIVLIGHDGHEEVEGTMGEAPEAHRPRRDRGRRRPRSRSPIPSKLAYISQTTLSVDETRAIITRLRERFPNITGPRTDDICYATTNRQAAVKQLAPQCDLVLVIGSRNSSNSNRLVEVAREHGADSYLIDHEEQVEEAWLEGVTTLGITSGASAPEELVQRLVQSFRDRGTTRRRGVRGRPRGRALHAPEDDPPGARGPGLTRRRRLEPRAQLGVVLAEARRSAGRPHRRPAEAQRRARRADAVELEHGLQAEPRGEREGLRDVVDRAGGDARGVQPLGPRVGGVRRERGLELGRQLVAMGDALGVRAKRGSAASSGRSRTPQRRSKMASLPPASARSRSAARKVSYGAIDGCRLPDRVGTAPALRNDEPRFSSEASALSISETSTCWPAPVAPRACSAASVPIAA